VPVSNPPEQGTSAERVALSRWLRRAARPHQYDVVFVSQDLIRRDDVAERAARVLRPPRKVLQGARAPG